MFLTKLCITQGLEAACNFAGCQAAKGYFTIETKLNKEQEESLEEFKQAWRQNMAK